MSSIFTKIIQGEIPCQKIAETENCFAFLDVSPLRMGHTLVIPKKEVNYIFNLEDELFTELHLFSKKVAKAVELAFPCLRIGVAVIGLEVPHAHIHLVPLNSMKDIDFMQPKLKPAAEELAQAADKIRSFFE